jgi:DNA-binding transcriptional MerR regulator
MGDPLELAIPKRALFKAAEVCDLAQLQPYVLRSWEAEFQDLGVARTAGGPRVYRRADVERVLRIKQLLFVEGLTLAGARKRLAIERPAAPAAADDPALGELFGEDARERIASVRDGLRGVLQLLSSGEIRAAVPEFELRPAHAPRPPRPELIGKPLRRAATARKAAPARKPAPKRNARRAGR